MLKMKKKFRLKTKIMFMNMGILIPIIILIYLITISNLYNTVINNSINFLSKESYTTQLYIINYLKNNKKLDYKLVMKNSSPLMTSYLSNKLSLRIQMYDEDLNILGDSLVGKSQLYDKDIVNAAKGNKAYIIRKIDGNICVMFSSPIYFNNKTVGCVRYIYPLIKEKKLINNVFVMMGILTVLGIGLAWILSNIFSGSIVSPIKKLRYMSEKLALGSYHSEIQINSGDEIEELAQTFNIMSKSIEKNIEKLKDEKQKQKNFLDNVTHEFKTPLTAIIGYSELIPRLKNENDIKESLYYIETEGQRLLKLVEELLELSKLGKNEFQIKKELNNIKDVVEESIHMIKPRLNKFGIIIKEEVCNREVFIDKDKTKQVILNILDNAIKYSDCDNIKISLTENSKYIILNICDNGIGILTADIEKIFQPMYRVSKLASRNKNGNGLGLSICKEIIEKQGGFIKMTSEHKKWTCIKVGFNKNIND
ncbi:sensor histidine kinase [Haloimpatiens sp. FM7330]|uniref:sensor histidine kinase n=1 Tax=Haloimpatiens sp. FM7330 TaxID=3298610 RepID=UPI00362BA76C